MGTFSNILLYFLQSPLNDPFCVNAELSSQINCSIFISNITLPSRAPAGRCRAFCHQLLPCSPRTPSLGRKAGLPETVTGVQAVLALSLLTIRSAGAQHLFVRSDIHQAGVMSVQLTIWNVTEMSPGEFVA